MFLQGVVSFCGLLPFGSERCALTALVGFSLVLLCSKHDFACFYEVLLALMGSCRSDQKGALSQLSLAFPFGFRARVRTLVASPIQFCVK